jgi:hypothetical protein
LYVIVDEQNYIQAADMLSTDLSHIHNWSQNWATILRNLYKSPVCQTLSNALEISQNINLVFTNIKVTDNSVVNIKEMKHFVHLK